MKQKDLGLDTSTLRTRGQIMLDEMQQVMPLGELRNSQHLHSKLGNLPPNAFEQKSAVKQPISLCEKTCLAQKA